MASDFNPFVAYDRYSKRLSESVVAKIKTATAPWQRPWDDSVGGSGMPRNGLTGNTYRGSNLLNLMMLREAMGYSSNLWFTYKQAQELGGQVRKGEKQPGEVVFWNVMKLANSKASDNDSQDNQTDRAYMFPRFYGIFNGDQIDGLPAPRVIERPGEEWRHEKADELILASGANITHDGMGRAFYRPTTDSIHLPEKAAFHSLDGYYATVLHELGHWTGHASRLNRDLSGPFGSESYAREELRAEIASWMIGDRLGIGHDPAQHAAYAKHWAQIIRQDPKEIMRACADAEKICQRLGIEPYEQVLAQSAQQARERSHNPVQVPVEPPREAEPAREEPVVQRRRSQGRGR